MRVVNIFDISAAIHFSNIVFNLKNINDISAADYGFVHNQRRCILYGLFLNDVWHILQILANLSIGDGVVAQITIDVIVV